jgi:hypothetical protein
MTTEEKYEQAKKELRIAESARAHGNNNESMIALIVPGMSAKEYDHVIAIQRAYVLDLGDQVIAELQPQIDALGAGVSE